MYSWIPWPKSRLLRECYSGEALYFFKVLQNRALLVQKKMNLFPDAVKFGPEGRFEGSEFMFVQVTLLNLLSSALGQQAALKYIIATWMGILPYHSIHGATHLLVPILSYFG